MTTIPLTQGQVAIIDSSDHPWLIAWKWYAWWNPCTQSFYAVRARSRAGGKPKGSVLMHRQILGLREHDGKLSDHRNGITLDNRRSNLRIATRLENNRNTRLSRSNRSGLKGVWFDKDLAKWRSCIRVKKRTVCLGSFTSKREAHMAYREAASKHFGEFARFA